MLLGRTLCQLMDQLQPKTGDPFAFFLFIYILLISCLPNFSNKNYHETGGNKLYAEHIVGLASITLCQHMDQLQPKTRNLLEMFVLYILLMLCLPNISKKIYHGTKEYQLYAKYKIRTGKCCLGEHCVSLWISYSLKQGIPWNFLLISILLISCLPNVSNKTYHDTG